MDALKFFYSSRLTRVRGNLRDVIPMAAALLGTLNKLSLEVREQHRGEAARTCCFYVYCGELI